MLYHCLSCRKTYDGFAQCCYEMDHISAKSFVHCLSCKKTYDGMSPCCRQLDHIDTRSEKFMNESVKNKEENVIIDENGVVQR